MNTVNVNLANGYIVTAIENSRSILDEIWKENIYEKDFRIEKGMTILDIGANQGFFSLYAASKGARVYSVEPESRNYNILCGNISGNKLENEITPYQYAISTKEGTVELYYLDYDKPFASGMVTAYRDFLDSVDKSTEKEIGIQRAEALSLKNFLQKIGRPRIDLLKIDCEGAELDILNSATPDSMKAVKALVMETHGTYSEKDIFFSVKSLGFDIVTYRKRGGVFQTGYLFAKNCGNDRRKTGSPVAVLDIPDYEHISRPVFIDGRNSFSSIHEDARLSFVWRINDQALDRKDSSFYHRFEKPGNYEVFLETIDGEGQKDTEKKNILILKEGYKKLDNREIRFLGSEEGKEYQLSGTMDFAAPLPDFWQPEVFVVWVVYKGDDRGPIRFEHNDEIQMLSDKVNYLCFEHVPIGIGTFCFSLSSVQPCLIQVSCGGMEKRRFRAMRAVDKFSQGKGLRSGL